MNQLPLLAHQFVRERDNLSPSLSSLSSLSLSPRFPISENFKQVWSETSIHKSVPFDFESGFTQQYFGQKKEHTLDYFEFSQLLQVCVCGGGCGGGCGYGCVPVLF